MTNKTFTPKYSSNTSERWLVEIAQMGKPRSLDYNGDMRRDYESHYRQWEKHIAQLKKYPASWITPDMKEPLELGKDFKIEKRSEFYTGAYHNMCAYCNKEFSGGDKLWFVCKECCDELIAVPVSSPVDNELCVICEEPLKPFDIKRGTCGNCKDKDSDIVSSPIVENDLWEEVRQIILNNDSVIEELKSKYSIKKL